MEKPPLSDVPDSAESKLSATCDRAESLSHNRSPKIISIKILQGQTTTIFKVDNFYKDKMCGFRTVPDSAESLNIANIIANSPDCFLWIRRLDEFKSLIHEDATRRPLPFLLSLSFFYVSEVVEYLFCISKIFSSFRNGKKNCNEKNISRRN